ncbi:MAG: exopolysaccharide biosynthesis polyprenyl glycosylphosphotransferase [Candidatus Marinimicrobia bacterium]|nr:exopolysaccharide biosynthesis polyprenyl glycosylphosphotransferase [Candidatus Neomarinimicrobiota bacterium]
MDVIVYIKYFIIVVVTLAASFVYTRIARAVATRYHIGDVPGPRKVHKVFIPYLGGVAIYLSFLTGLLLLLVLLRNTIGGVPKYYPYLLIPSFLAVLVGLYDDLKKLGFATKFYAQIIISIIVVISGFEVRSVWLPLIGNISLGYLNPFFTVLWIVFFMNALNLLDGLDGLASGVSTIIFTCFAVISFYHGNDFLGILNIILIASNLGFLRYNYHPASIFMGDSGSLFLGYTISIMSLEVGKRIGNSIDLALILTIMAIPFLDTTISFFRRASKKSHPFLADKEHIHHRLMSIGFSHLNAVRIIYFFSIMAGLMGIAYTFVDDKGGITILLVGGILAGLLIRRLGYVEIEKNLITVENGNENGKINSLLNGNGGSTKKEPQFFDKDEFVQTLIFIVSDIFFIVLSFLLVYYLWFLRMYPVEKMSDYETTLWCVWFVIFWVSLIGLNDLYKIEWDVSRVDMLYNVLKIVAFGILLFWFLEYSIEFPFGKSKRALLLYGFVLFSGIGFGRLLIITVLKNREILGFKRRPTLVVGGGRRVKRLIDEIKSIPELKFDIVGIIDEKNSPRIGEKINGVEIIGGYNEIPEIVARNKIKEVIIALDDPGGEDIIDLIALFNKYKVSIKLVPDFYNLLSGFKTSHIYGISLIRFFESNMKTWEWLFKRLIDILISLFVLVAFLPIWVIIAIVIVIDSPGPIFYKQKRVGKNKKEFNMIKFRSMVKDAEELTGPKWAERDDPRITRVGRILRKFGLDEVPQFFNVLMGDMSIVGPRPERPYFVNELEKKVRFYSRRLIVKPGITGWAQIKHKYDETIDDVKEKLRYDLYYIGNMSVLLDLKIIVQTILMALRRKYHHRRI